MGVTSCATLPFLPGTHVFSTVFKLLQANSTLFKHLWLVTPDGVTVYQESRCTLLTGGGKAPSSKSTSSAVSLMDKLR